MDEHLFSRMLRSHYHNEQNPLISAKIKLSFI